jgi:CelD/BcsL family acetyltransferase involved in cellulose biosynthesis
VRDATAASKAVCADRKAPCFKARQFDLSVGNYAFKRRFGALPIPLTDVSLLLGWRGPPLLLRDHAAQWIRRYPALSERLARALGKPPPREL